MKCTYCGNEATKYCRTHRRAWCENPECYGFHRTSVRPRFCDVVDPPRVDWMDLFIALCGVSVAITVTALAWGALVEDFVKTSLEAQMIDKSCWYYENGASIDLILSIPRVGKVGRKAWKQGSRRSSVDDNFIHIRIPSSKLAATLKRQGKVR